MQNVQDIPEKFNGIFTSQLYLFWKVLVTYLKTKDIYLL